VNARKFSTVCIVLALSVLIALSGFWDLAAAKSQIVQLEKGQTIGLGTQGLHVTNIPDGVTHVYLDTVGTNLPSRFSHKTDIQYRAPAMELRFLNARGGQVAQVNALVYVYFNIGRADRDLWLESGMDRIAIWFADEQTGSWKLCPTFFVDQSNAFRTGGRLACLAPGSGYYVLGQSDFGTSLPKSQTADGEKAASNSSPDPANMNRRAYGGPYSADSHTLLLLHLDGGYDGAQGEVGTSTGTEFTAGRFAQGVLMDDADTLTYTATGHLDANQGAVEFWLRPDWHGDDGGNHTLFWWGEGSDFLHLRKDGISNLVFDRFYAGGSCGAPMHVADWRAGDWHHLAITWQGVDMSLFVDGWLVAQTSCGGTAQPTASTFYIGSGIGGELAVDALIDELRISDIPRLGSAALISTARPSTLNVRAYIDGRSQLFIQGNAAHWRHLDFAAPGRHFDAEINQPTFLNQAIWEPIWPDVPDTENRDCYCDSSSYEGIPNLAKTDQPVQLEVVQGRGEVFISQQPNAANNYTLVIELDDNPFDGPTWYEINLGY